MDKATDQRLLADLTIAGKPIAKKRHRTSGRRTYDPQSEEKETVRWLMRSKYDGPALFEALSVEMVFYVRRPKAITEKVRPYPMVKPDLDNYIKMVWDCGNGVLWVDDACIVETKAKKLYDDDQRTKIIVRRMSDG